MYSIICSEKASYLDLQERLSVRDAFNLLEIIAVESHNEKAWREHLEKQ
ncbi:MULTISPECIES: hypothetical protein [Edwardsiella]|uniref:Uncharacterized protein n=1 Tax=Edwardsiella phage GF-2 TaxID=1537091 RepID=A0A077KAX1_9CAUD|nr:MULTISPECIES: hypothetical protein [Edwardsiella]YP_009126620.1 hypothetical protein VC56_gp17 [Edwardsiella phage GF-2]ELM3659808.1 hypothetical protein [Edwardsiella piscicida]QPW26498.1 hypothetical protein F8538_06385 [Edwardsiella ictaluri]UCQ36386.1 hypothetical protein DCF36_08990 [Edwardsiella piscicida]BAP28888.1 hypothetical protein [Edwardsiella phage GF-2]